MTAAILICALCSAESDSSETATIKAAWRERQDATRSVRFVWRSEHFKSRSYLRSLGARFPRQGGDEAGNDHLSYERTFTLVVDGRRMHCIDDGFDQVGATRELFPRVAESVFDDEAHTSFARRKGPSGDVVPQAVISASNHDLHHHELLPILWTYRMLDPEMQVIIDTDRLALSAEPCVFEGRDCVILTEGKVSLWVDPRRDYSIVKYLRGRLGKDGRRTQIVVHYVEDGELWVPQRWQMDHFVGADAAPLLSTTTVMTEYEINPQVPASEFEMEIPVGALVIDQRDPLNEVKYVQRANDVQIPVKTARRSYEELLEDVESLESQTETAPTKLTARGLLVLAHIVAFALLIVWLARREHARRNRK